MTDFENANIGRNEPCPCGSGKKFKRCHGVDAAPKLTLAKNPNPSNGAPGGFDPSQFDPAMLAQFTQMLQRLPKGQMQRLQTLMQKAMSGKDVSREAAEFEGTLPVEMQEMMRGFKMPGMEAPAVEATPEVEAPSLSEDQARVIVEQAYRDGKISKEEAEKTLGRKL